jgi:hypothetical protein
MEIAYFVLFLLHRVLMTPAIYYYDRAALRVSLLNGTILLHMQTLLTHKPDTYSQFKKPLPNESEPSLDLPFKDANDYSSYMKKNGIWGSCLEAEVIAKFLRIPILIWNKHTRRCYDVLNYRPSINTCGSTIYIIYSNGNYYDALIFQGSKWENERMTLSLISDRSTSATRPHVVQSAVDNASNETLLPATYCSKREKLLIGSKNHCPLAKDFIPNLLELCHRHIMSNLTHQMKLKRKLQ